MHIYMQGSVVRGLAAHAWYWQRLQPESCGTEWSLRNNRECFFHDYAHEKLINMLSRSVQMGTRAGSQSGEDRCDTSRQAKLRRSIGGSQGLMLGGMNSQGMLFACRRL